MLGRLRCVRALRILALPVALAPICAACRTVEIAVAGCRGRPSSAVWPSTGFRGFAAGGSKQDTPATKADDASETASAAGGDSAAVAPEAKKGATAGGENVYGLTPAQLKAIKVFYKDGDPVQFGYNFEHDVEALNDAKVRETDRREDPETDADPGLDPFRPDSRNRDPYGLSALLSNDAKRAMYELHVSDPVTYTVDALASVFAIRVERVAAILHLVGEEVTREAAGETLDATLAAAMEHLRGATRTVGAGEAHCAAYGGKPLYMRFLPGEDMETEWAHVPSHAELSARQGRVIADNFTRRLEFNAGRTAPGLRRRAINADRPPRPPGGYGIVIIPAGKAAVTARGGAFAGPPSPRATAPVERASFVSRPDATTRPLSGDEQEYVVRKLRRQRHGCARRNLIL